MEPTSPRRLPRGAYVICLLICLHIGGLSACKDDGSSRDNLRLEVSALGLAGVGDVAYAVSVARLGGGLVWSKSPLSATAYGNGRDLTYVGPCDASPGSNPHTVRIEVLDLFDEVGERILPATYRNPGPVDVTAVCRSNADTLVEVSLTLMRDAQQGFFDVAVTFDELFCSAKLDCKDEGLVFDPRTQERRPTAVIGLSCAGPTTHLWLDELVLTCGSSSQPLDIFGPDGNQYTALAMPPTPLAQVATYRGTSVVSGLELVYFDVGIAIDPTAITTDCSLSFGATASRSIFATPFSTPTNTVWPRIRWEMPLVSAATRAFVCDEHPLDDPSNPPGQGVFTDYVRPPSTHTFDYRVGRDLSAPVGSGLTTMERRVDGPNPLGEGVVMLFADADDDGLEDPGELRLPNIAVRFDGPGGTVDRTTDLNGVARTPLDAGAWSVSFAFDAPGLEGFVTSRPALPASFAVNAGGTTAVAIGLVEAAEVRGHVFVASLDGTTWSGDEATLVGVTVEARRAGVGEPVATTSNDEGRYRLVLPPGSWTLALPSQPALAGGTPLGSVTVVLTPGGYLAVPLGVAP